MIDTTLIANDPDGTALDNVIFTPGDKSFVLGVSPSILEECRERGIDPRFFTAHAPSFYNHGSLTTLENATGIKGLEQLMQEKTTETAHAFMTGIEKAASNPTIPAPFNGETYGVSAITTGRAADANESLIIHIDLHNSDYFTAVTMNNVYKALRRDNIAAFQDASLGQMPQGTGAPLGIFFNSFGLNSSVVIDDQYICGTRPNGALHVAMNEGIRPTNDTDAPFTLTDVYNRGMREELGQKIAPASHVTPPIVREVFFVNSAGQFGIHTLSKLNTTYDQFLLRHARAKDAFENARFEPVAYTVSSLQSLAANETGP